MPITSFEPSEYSTWAAIWRAFIDRMNATLSESQYKSSWSRIQDPNGDLHGLAARDENGTIVGLAHYLFMGRSWKDTPVVYLEDLFVLPEARGKGYGKQLHLAVAAAGAAKGCDAMHWKTGLQNDAAREFYDRLGAKSECRWYDMDLPYKQKES
ncbi:hypothetical protein MMC10_006959 [Thelotrema lepadinum]|nr:hypothetical protein [Thelotrema lepadinum]